VPKFLVNADGSPGQRNEVQCASIEHKARYPREPDCRARLRKRGRLPGRRGDRGLEYMFIMMNLARFRWAWKGLAIAERAYQQALGYAKDESRAATSQAAARP